MERHSQRLLPPSSQEPPDCPHTCTTRPSRTRMRLGARASGTCKQLGVPLCAAGVVLCMEQPPHPQSLPNSLRPCPACLPILVMAYHVSICWFQSRPCSCSAMRPCSLPGEPSRLSILSFPPPQQAHPAPYPAQLAWHMRKHTRMASVLAIPPLRSRTPLITHPYPEVPPLTPSD
jgi:hypothetical protein